MSEFRNEHDSMGEIQVPFDAYYGAQTQRAVNNFQISNQPLRPELIQALGLVKLAAAEANRDLERFSGTGRTALDKPSIAALLNAAREVSAGHFDGEFPVDVYQTGSGTSSNMNANEVISNRAIELAGGNRRADQKLIHPNDHVNLGQSTNDIFPTAIHVACALAMRRDLLPALEHLAGTFREKALAWDQIVKIGRTHLADATPLRLGQEFSGFARQLELSCERAGRSLNALLELPVGGTAVGTGINTHPEFGKRVCGILNRETAIAFREAANHFEANAQRDGLVECHAGLRVIATTLFNVANNLRWLSSGPRCGFYEIELPDLQPGSSIMPGKVNPVLCESLMQAAARVMGNDQVVSFSGAAGGQFQLNIMMPVMGQATVESISLLARGTSAFDRLCVSGIEANAARCTDAVERSLALVTSLTPYIGYDRAAQLAKEALHSGKTIREVCREQHVLSAEQLDEALDAWGMTEPSAP